MDEVLIVIFPNSLDLQKIWCWKNCNLTFLFKMGRRRRTGNMTFKICHRENYQGGSVKEIDQFIEVLGRNMCND